MIIIKSQNGEEIRKVDNIFIYPRTTTEFRIATTTPNSDIGILATYKTRKRAQQVIDEIYDRIKFYLPNITTYTMPKE